MEGILRRGKLNKEVVSLVCIGEYVKTYDGFEGFALRKTRSSPSDKEFTIHIREKTGNIHICSERMIEECSGNPDPLIAAIRNLVNEIDILRRESIELVEENNTYKGYLFEGNIGRVPTSNTKLI